VEEKREVQVKERLDSAARSVTGGREGGGEERPPKRKGNKRNCFSLCFLSALRVAREMVVMVVCLYPSALPKDKFKPKPKPGEKETNKNSPEVERPPEKKKKKKKEESAGFDGSVRSIDRSVGRKDER
jgi:hypothetical protein